MTMSKIELTDGYEMMARPQLKLMSEDQVRQIHEASLEVLERTGVRVLLPEALTLLEQAGADVRDKNSVKIPSWLVEECLRHAPKRITVYDRNGEPAMRMQGNNVHYGLGTDTKCIIDVDTGERRLPRGDDVAKAAQICDYLPNISFCASMGGASPEEVDPSISDRHNFVLQLENTTKPILFTSWSLEGLADIHKMASMVTGSAGDFRNRPFMIHYTEPITPLTHPPDSLQKLMFCAEKGIPVVYVSGPIMGGTAPVTLAGAITLSNAEFLSGLVITQLKRKGAPIITGGGSAPLDMKTSVYLYVGPEAMLCNVALKELAAFYGLPDFNTGGCSDAKVLDEQAAYEACFSILQAGLAGSSMVHDVGYLESGLTACWELMVLADEMIEANKYFLKGIEVNRETMAVDLIHKVGAEGNFLGEAHTMQHFKSIWYPDLLNRENYETWEAGGSKTLGQVLNEKVKWILENHIPKPLSVETRKGIQAILDRAGESVAL